MTELSDKNPTGRFAGLADIYSRCRPGYPVEAIDYILYHCSLAPGSILIDVGCGTGISTRLFADRGLNVIGIEPNAEMLAKAREAAHAAHASLALHDKSPEGGEPVAGSAGGRPAQESDYREGKAEATGLAAHYADAVLSAQAFHWFRAEEALAEFHRILKPSGWCVLMWNERDESDAFTAEYGALLRTLPETAAVEMPRGQAGNALLESALFINRTRVAFPNEQILDEDGLLGRAFSASYAPREAKLADEFSSNLRKLFSRFATSGLVTLRYETSVYTGQSPA